MSVTVRCPGCDARFRATEDQLRVAHGWVRCGQCQHSFDAAIQEEAPSAGVPPQRAPLLQRVSSDGHGNSPSAGGAAKSTQESLIQQVAREERRKPLQHPVPTAPAALSVRTPAFLREPLARPASGGSAGWRALGWFFGIGLGMLLLAQVLLQQRDWLAARAPATAPILKNACVLLGCVISPPRQIDALSISNSSLTKTGSDSYRLSIALKNRSDLQLAMPGIELSLLDPAERTVLRRVLLARDVGANDSLAPFDEWVGALHFDLPGQPGQIAGYRVLAFYP